MRHQLAAGALSLFALIVANHASGQTKLDSERAHQRTGGDALSSWECTPQSPAPFVLPSVSIGGQLPPAGNQGYEASGLVWHPRLNKLFAVHDGNASLLGSVTLLNLSGGQVQNWVIGSDLEGVTIADPATNFVYLAREQPNDSILEFNFVTGVVTKVWDLTNLANCTSGCATGGVPFPDPPGNAGIEAITFVPDAGPSGGVFYLGLQSDGRIYKVRVNLSSTTGQYQYLGHAARLGPWNGTGGVGIQGLEYDRANNVLWALVGQRRARAMRPDGSLLREWPMPEPSGTIEGIALANATCEFIVAWDDFEGGPTNRIRKYGFRDCITECDTSCDDGNPCTDDATEPGGGCTSTPNSLPCDDSNPCTLNDHCANGLCATGTPLACENGLFCDGQSTCNPATGACVNGPPPCINAANCNEAQNVCMNECFSATLAPAPEPCPMCGTSGPLRKNRYLSFLPPPMPTGATSIALRVTLVSMPGPSDCPGLPDFSAFAQKSMWVGPFVAAAPDSTAVFALTTAPVWQNWTTASGGTVHVSDCNILPCARYTVDAIANNCGLGTSPGFSPALPLWTTTVWGDVAGLSPDEPPNDLVNFIDVSAVVDAFQMVPDAPSITRTDLYGAGPFGGGDAAVTFIDISAAVDAFQHRDYANVGPTAPLACSSSPPQ